MSEYTVIYTYSEDRASRIREYGKNDEAGQLLMINYADGYTMVRSSGSDDRNGTEDDTWTRYTFDNEGRVKGVYSTDANKTKIYGATVGQYENTDNEKVRNNLKTAVTVGGSPTNYLLNGAFERGSGSNIEYWDSTTNVSRYLGYISADGIYEVNFEVYANTTDSISQNTFLPEGTYTLSLDANTFNCENVTLRLKAESLDTIGKTFVEEIPINEHYVSDGAISANMQIEADSVTNGGERFKISIETVGGSTIASAASVDIDFVMLEESITTGNFSFVEMGNFEEFALNSSGVAVERLGTFWTNQDNELVTSTSSGPFDTVGYVEGSISEERYIKQTVYTVPDSALEEYDYAGGANGQEKKTYVVSGFAKGTGQVANQNSKFGLRVDVTYYQGSANEDEVISHYFEFDTDCVDWQFVAGTFSTEANQLVRQIDVICEYSYQPSGYAMFDSIALTKGTDVVEYDYYDETDGDLEGLLHVISNDSYITVYEYNEDKQVSRVAYSTGELYDYTYDSTGVNVTREMKYTYTLNNGAVYYPYDAEDPDAMITKTAVLMTDNLYNSYGLLIDSNTGDPDYLLNSFHNNYSYNTTSGSKIFGALVSELDTLDRQTRYYHDAENGRLLATINVDEGTGICYTYDDIGNLISVMPATYRSSSSYNTVTDGEWVEYTYNSANQLAMIDTDSTTYEFVYDNFGNTDSVSVGNTTLAEYVYNDYNGKLNTIHYGNGISVNYVYDELENIKEVWYTDDEGTETQAYPYTYTSDGQVHRFENLLTGTGIYYQYNTDGKLFSYTEYDIDEIINTFGASFYYDEKDRLGSMYYSGDYSHSSGITNYTLDYFYSYTVKDALNYYMVDTETTSGKIDYSYDVYDRLHERVVDFYLTSDTTSRYTNTVSYTFEETEYGTSSQVKTYTSVVNDNTGVTYNYEYDYNGNITRITLSTGEEYRYVYDDLGQLIREDNSEDGCTYVYTYDDAGNILSKKTYALTAAGVTPTTLRSSYTYGYTDANWGDKLTSYNGAAITYDEIGNPLSYYNGASFTWENGRRLATATKGSYTLAFEYNSEGIRTSKTVNGVEHIYHLNGSQIISEEWGNHLLLYIYDAEGTPIGMQYRKATYAANEFDTYWFEKNLQGDIVAVYSEDGTKLISYTYDAWGNFTTTYSNGGAATTATYNPFTYRGYYYDAELGLYYLNSRYYDGNTGRFINADACLSTGNSVLDFNIYVYCLNNPINMSDSMGYWPKWLEDVGARFVHVVTIMGRIALSPFKAITAEVGVGVGLGATAEVAVNNVPVELSAVYSVTDSLVYENGSFDARNTTSANVGLAVANLIDLSHSNGHSHSYFDENCTCSFFESTFGEKSSCVANQKFASNDATLGFSIGAYFILGGELSVSIDIAAWDDELVSIQNDIFAYGR